eukprot:CAMPEP_0116056458 /NCGR_PEP_ID=MMETSP0322-20121206/4033_1 /TAXON_ID=163516 /ORGANISM="Leptocylindrus danicus var. apora, Strain B651" /LENGTH=617 /DNA_ID=CAMNT_0003540293 /DNA_START=35 /DNA_END=1885 /DNA_ORIENTATION=+
MVSQSGSGSGSGLSRRCNTSLLYTATVAVTLLLPIQRSVVAFQMDKPFHALPSTTYSPNDLSRYRSVLRESTSLWESSKIEMGCSSVARATCYSPLFRRKEHRTDGIDTDDTRGRKKQWSGGVATAASVAFTTLLPIHANAAKGEVVADLRAAVETKSDIVRGVKNRQDKQSSKEVMGIKRRFIAPAVAVIGSGSFLLSNRDLKGRKKKSFKKADEEGWRNRQKKQRMELEELDRIVSAFEDVTSTTEKDLEEDVVELVEAFVSDEDEISSSIKPSTRTLKPDDDVSDVTQLDPSSMIDFSFKKSGSENEGIKSELPLDMEKAIEKGLSFVSEESNATNGDLSHKTNGETNTESTMPVDMSAAIENGLSFVSDKEPLNAEVKEDAQTSKLPDDMLAAIEKGISFVSEDLAESKNSVSSELQANDDIQTKEELPTVSDEDEVSNVSEPLIEVNGSTSEKDTPAVNGESNPNDISTDTSAMNSLMEFSFGSSTSTPSFESGYDVNDAVKNGLSFINGDVDEYVPLEMNIAKEDIEDDEISTPDLQSAIDRANNFVSGTIDLHGNESSEEFESISDRTNGETPNIDSDDVDREDSNEGISLDVSVSYNTEDVAMEVDEDN